MTPTLSVSEFIAIFNQSMQMMLPEVNVRGELANFRISKNTWVYFDLKDDQSSLKFFGPVNVLPGPLEDGMKLEVNGAPWLHNRYGFSVNVRNLKIVGEGSIAKGKMLLAKKLEAEGLFSEDRKRPLAYPPAKIALVTSVESAAYSDFIKIINARWGNIEVDIYDCLVQGMNAPAQIVQAINYINQMAKPPEVMVLIRGGGSEDDLAAFSDERVIRAVSSSRVPSLVAIGHERDISLAELAADQRASTPSNAAELLVPDVQHEKSLLDQNKKKLQKNIAGLVDEEHQENQQKLEFMIQILNTKVEQNQRHISQMKSLLSALNPKLPLAKGYALVKNSRQKQVRLTNDVKIKEEIYLELMDGTIISKVEKINERKQL